MTGSSPQDYEMSDLDLTAHDDPPTLSGSWSFFVAGTPVPGGSKKAFAIKKDGKATGQVVVTDMAGKRGMNWTEEIQRAASAFALEHPNVFPLMGVPVRLDLRFYRQRPKAHYRSNGELKPGLPSYPLARPDALKLARRVEDALTGIVYQDDSQIVDGSQSKRWALEGEGPGVQIVVSLA